MTTVILKQIKPLQVNIFGYVFLLLTPILWYYNQQSLGKVSFVFILGLLFIGYTITFEINKDFRNYKILKMFGVTCWKGDLKLFFPEYISLLPAVFKKDNEWGAVAALGTKSTHQRFVIKFFKGAKKEIVYIDNDYPIALKAANDLSMLLGVRLHNAHNK